VKFGAFDLPRRRGPMASPPVTVVVSADTAAIAIMKPAPTDNNPRRRGDATNNSLQIIAGLWNLKTHNQLRVNDLGERGHRRLRDHVGDLAPALPRPSLPHCPVALLGDPVELVTHQLVVTHRLKGRPHAVDEAVQ
jgi:hypothetical protein